MDKILHTQLTHIYNTLHAQEDAIEIASRYIAQAIIGEGHVYWKLFDDFMYIDDYLTDGELKLKDSMIIEKITDIQSPDRIIIVAKHFNDEVIEFLDILDRHNLDYVVIANKNKEKLNRIESLHHFIDLASPREVLPTPEFNKIVNPYMSAFFYLYYQMYVLIDEMINDA